MALILLLSIIYMRHSAFERAFFAEKGEGGDVICFEHRLGVLISRAPGAEEHTYTYN